MSVKHRVSQIIELFGYKYRLHQVIPGIQGESSCYMSVIKGKSCIFREYNRISKRVGEDGYLESFISSRPRFKSETRYTKF